MWTHDCLNSVFLKRNFFYIHLFWFGYFGFVNFFYSIDFKETNEQAKEKSGFLSSFLKFEVAILAIAHIVNRLARSFFLPTFTNNTMKKFFVSVESVSLMQAIGFLGYYITFKNFEYLIIKLGVKLLLALALLINFISVISIGPIFILPQYLLFYYLKF